MILIPGRSSKQGTSLNKGKLKEEYQTVTSTLEVNEDDMIRLGLEAGDKVKLSNEIGETIVSVKKVFLRDSLYNQTLKYLKKQRYLSFSKIFFLLKSFLNKNYPVCLFIPYGPPSSQLMEGDTGSTGMPLSKHMEVIIEKV